MTELDKLLGQDDKGQQQSENTPARLLRGLMLDMNISPLTMNTLLNQWLNRLKRKDKPLDGNERSNKRGNLIKEISRDSITWNVFEKAIAVLDFDEWEITFKGKKNGQLFKRNVKYQVRTPQEKELFDQHIEHNDLLEKVYNENAAKQPTPQQPGIPAGVTSLGALYDSVMKNK